jgi:phage terminase large subunit-like protein
MAYKTDFSKIDLDKYFFDDKTANTVVKYIEENVKHVKGDLAGKPFILEEWQKNDIIRPLFGWKHIDTGLRKYTSAYIEIPKKSGKSFLAASVACIFIDMSVKVVPKLWVWHGAANKQVWYLKQLNK